MMTEASPREIRIQFKPHSGQRKIINERKRFNALNLGRRFGKTYLGIFLLMETATKGFPVAWYSPSYKDLQQVWKRVKKKLAPLIQSKNEQLKSLQLVNGAVIDFWSLDDPDNSRGRRYKRVIIDECAKIRKFEEAYKQTVRATLTDFQGDGYFLSTPKGKGNYWYQFCQEAQRKDEWAYFRMPTSTNPYIPLGEVESAKKDLSDNEYQQEYEAHFIDFTGNAFFENLEDSKLVKGLEFDWSRPVTLGFDFNYNPVSLSLIQVLHGEGINVLYSLQGNGGTEKFLEEHCQWIRNLIDDGIMDTIITGDCNGHRKESTSGEITDYSIIERFFNRPIAHITYGANASHLHSRKICNAVLRKCNVRFSEENAEELFIQMRETRCNSLGKIDKSSFDPHLPDTFRYIINTHFETSDDVNVFASQIRQIEEELEALNNQEEQTPYDKNKNFKPKKKKK